MNRQTSAAVKTKSSLCYDCCCGCIDEGETVNKGSGAVVIESGGYNVALADNKRKLYCAALSEVPSPVDNADGSCSLRCEGRLKIGMVLVACNGSDMRGTRFNDVQLAVSQQAGRKVLVFMDAEWAEAAGPRTAATSSGSKPELHGGVRALFFNPNANIQHMGTIEPRSTV